MIVTFDPQFKPWLGASQDDFRPQLRAVFVDPAGYLVATTTNLLLVVPCEIEDAPLGFTGVSIPSAWLQTIARFKPKKATQFTLSVDVKAGTVSAFTNLGEVTTPLVFADAKHSFPNWKRALPSDFTGVAHVVTGLKAKDVDIVSRALNITSRFRLIAPRADGAMLVLGDEGSFALFMPIVQDEMGRDEQIVEAASAVLEKARAGAKLHVPEIERSSAKKAA